MCCGSCFASLNASQTSVVHCCHFLHAELFIKEKVSLLFSKCQMVVLCLNKVTAATDLHFYFGFDILILGGNRHNCSPSTG